MPVATTGLVMLLQDALRQLTDAKGNQLEFTEQKDGTWTTSDVEGDNYVYNYTLNPQPAMVTVSEGKTSKEEKKKQKESSKKSEEKPSGGGGSGGTSSSSSSRRNPV